MNVAGGECAAVERLLSGIAAFAHRIAHCDHGIVAVARQQGRMRGALGF